MAKEKLNGRDFLRMLEKIQLGPDDECWPWRAATNAGEYDQEHGRFRVGTRSKGELVYPHIVMWELYNDITVPKGQYVLHGRTCAGQGSCCNPTHLRVGTQKENAEDARAIGHTSKGEHRPLAKLRESDVLEIRQRSDAGERIVDIAKEYPVSKEIVRQVALRKAWKHVID